MAYFDQAMLSNDGDFFQRVAACAQNEIDLGETHPTKWAGDHIWQVAAAPGFADAYATAVLNDVEQPGRDPSVISDNQILAAVVAI
jgi:hypothetical protein